MVVIADVHPKALDRHVLYHNVYAAMDAAVKHAFAQE
jgi:formaldehyde-activating enzyme involved in methanogenesis